MKHICILLFVLSIPLSLTAKAPVKLIFDTDMGNDIDDAMALAMIHSLVSRGECELLAVTVTKDHPQAAAFVDLINTFYGRPDIPIGVVKEGMAKEPSKYTVLADHKQGDRQRYPHDLTNGNQAPDALKILRKTLAAAKDKSIVIAQVGFSTNLSRLMNTKPDSISPLSGIDLIKSKVHHLEVMAGSFTKIGNNKRFLEYNVKIDIPNAKRILELWPSDVVISGFEIGISLRYPARSILEDFNYVEKHPIPTAYQLYNPTPHERPTWDLTSVLHGVRPNRGYFDLSAPGEIKVHDDGYTEFIPQENGTRKFLILKPEDTQRVRDTLVHLTSQPQ
ncbi:MAG: nucleoside hydrolase [Planctomycetaceae bacterium]|nr:nucleoside hydrolase [Planctomycetaceae bacterium]